MKKLKENYVLAKCCRPGEDDSIVGYYSHDNFIKVHRSDCHNLKKTDSARLITLDWRDLYDIDDFVPGDDYEVLDGIDFSILRHHQVLGVDYSLEVAAVLRLSKQTVFDRHRKLREMKLLKRVQPVMIRYRKNIVKNKWIKHRNHTYYDLTGKGRDYLRYYFKNHDGGAGSNDS
jgi:hypothetical protein